MKQFSLTCGLLGLCCLMALPGFAVAQDRNATSEEALQQDPRLQRSLDIDVTGVTVEELLRTFSRQGLTLKADSSCAQQKVQIHLKHRPLYVLMRALAQLLPATWQAGSDQQGYRFNMTPRAVRRREEWWALFLEARQQALNAQRDYLLQTMRAEPKQAVYENMTEEMISARKSSASFFKQLPATLQEQIANQINDIPFYKPRPSFGTSDREGELIVPLHELPSPIQDMAQSYVTRRSHQYNLPGDTTDAVLHLTNGGLGFQASITLADGQWTGTAFQMTPMPLISPQAAALLLDHSQLTAETHRHRDMVPDTWIKLAAYHESKVWKNALPLKRLYNSSLPRRRSQMMKQLAANADIEFVADYYSKRGVPIRSEAQAAPLLRPLAEELNDIGIEQDVSWKQNADSLFLFRNNHWYRDDRLEAPTPLLTRWQQQRILLDKAPPTRNQATNADSALHTRQVCDWQAEVVSQLTLWQISNGFKYFVPEPADDKPHVTLPEKSTSISSLPRGIMEDSPFYVYADLLTSQYRTLLFYASLDAQARLTLQAGNMPFASLTEAQQAQVLYLLPGLNLYSSASKAHAQLGIRVEDGSPGVFPTSHLTFTLR